MFRSIRGTGFVSLVLVPALFSQKKKKYPKKTRDEEEFFGQNSTLKRGQELKNGFRVCCNVAVRIFQETDRQGMQVFWGFFSFFMEFKEPELALVVRKVGICSVGKENQNLPV